jgi:hypothetical protein
MRLRGFLFCTALLTMNLINVKAAPPFSLSESGPEDPWAYATSPVAAPLPRMPSPLLEQDKVLGAAYYDALNILSSENSCSQFFGGPTGSVMVLNRLMSQVRKDYFANSIGMRMSGEVTSGFNSITKTRYRMFDKVSINANGPFYRKKVSPTEPTIPRLGGYEPNTRQVRALILLHELGHLMKGDDGNWLLPDDGKAEAVSRENSQKIEEVCGEQINNLTKAGTK